MLFSLADKDEPKKHHIFELFNHDIGIIKNAYLKLFEHGQLFDYDGEYLREIYQVSPTILESLIDTVLKRDSYLSNHSRFPSLDWLWLQCNYLDAIKNLCLYVFEHQKIVFIDSFATKVFSIKRASDDKKKTIKMRHKEVMLALIADSNNQTRKLNNLLSIVYEKSILSTYEFVEKLLSHNIDTDIFESLHLYPMHRTWTGSAVPLHAKQKKTYQELLPLVSEPELLDHRLHVEKLIDYEEKKIERAKRSDFVERN
jgi:hypothetical protein